MRIRHTALPVLWMLASLLFLAPLPTSATVIGEPYAVTAANLEKTFTNIERPTLLFVYASWCPYCKTQAKVIHDLWKESQGRYHILPLSLDTDPEALSRFWNPQPIGNASPVYYARDLDLIALLAAHGMQFSGGIPYMALLTKDGVIAEHSGTLEYGALKEALEEAAKGIPADPRFNSY